MASKNWSIEDLKKKGLVFNDKDKVVPVSSLVDPKPVKMPFLSYQIDMEEEKHYADKLFILPTKETIYCKYRFDITPVSAPRMTQSDKWRVDPNHTDPRKRQRQPVTNYFAFKNKLVGLCAESGYKLAETLRILFIIPFPDTYSKKKRAQLNGKPHDQKPDVDNLIKCFLDSMTDNDKEVWDVRAIKLWGYEGQIIIF